ncbi:MAG: phenylalanine--tRNA ligase subunit alpha [Patescibacteria group bacterium]
MEDEIKKIQKEARAKLAAVKNQAELRDFEVLYLGRKGELTTVLRQLKGLSDIQKRMIGTVANKAKGELVAAFEKKRSELEQTASASLTTLEATWPGAVESAGRLHPITQFLQRVEDIFISMGFEVIDGPEVETPRYNFDLLNIPKDHPARDMWDTYYVEQGLVLRTHTSPVQLRAMEKRKPPVRLIAPGRVFRHEATDAGHETTFYQCEGLVIDRCITVANLIQTVDQFLKAVFGPQVKTRVRPELYPFVEPGIDFDMRCLICGGAGCSVCKQRGWLETLGSGMVHPKVLRNMGVDPEQYSGFAFGLGIDRLMMLRHGINDIRLSYSGDFRFLEQF